MFTACEEKCEYCVEYITHKTTVDTEHLPKNNSKQIIGALHLLKSNLIVTIFPSGPKVVTKPQVNERLDDAVQRCKFSKKGLRF